MAVMFVYSGHAQVEQVDWTQFYTGTVDQSQTAGTATSYPLYRNFYGWNRAVSAWQMFQPGVSGDLGGIAVDLLNATAGGSVDLNIYAGAGVQGTLLESTHLEWTSGFNKYPGVWYTLLLSTPVTVTAGDTYTFSFENLSSDTALRYVVDPTSNPYSDGEYFQQGYFFGGQNYYTSPSTTADMNFETIMDPISPAPEPSFPAIFAMSMLGGGLLLLWPKK